MATKKKEGAGGASRGKGSSGRKTAARAPRSDAYEVALERFGAALERLRTEDYAGAREMFERLAKETVDETELADRSRTYARICEQRLATAAAAPQTSDGFYYQGVVKANQGALEEANRLLDAAVELDPRSAKAFYAKLGSKESTDTTRDALTARMR